MRYRPPLTPLSSILQGSLGKADRCMHTSDAWDLCKSGDSGRAMAPATVPEMQKPRMEAGRPHVLPNKVESRKKRIGWVSPDVVVGCPKLPN